MKFMENYFFLENYVTVERAVFHNVLLSTSPHYQVRFNANDYFE